MCHVTDSPVIDRDPTWLAVWTRGGVTVHTLSQHPHVCTRTEVHVE